MIQTAGVITKTGTIVMEFPAPDTLLLDGVRWGAVDAFPTPAYWQCQVIERRLIGKPPTYRLGRTLTEEVAACLLGGHGIPASVGIAAYERLRERGAFAGIPPSFEQLETWLREPLLMGQRQVRYRFASQKARYLAEAIPLAQSAPVFTVGRDLRNWLMQLSGVGPKTASWIARNWMDADDVAILDVHIMRVGQAVGLFPKKLTVERHYFELEALFLQFSAALDVRTAELDAVIWYEMATSPSIVRMLVEHLRETSLISKSRINKKASKQVQLSFT